MMGHKGVSIRKPSQKKNNKGSSDNAKSGVSSVEQAAGSQPELSKGADKLSVPVNRGGGKQSSDPRKNPKKR
jgi:hypothetical protein